MAVEERMVERVARAIYHAQPRNRPYDTMSPPHRRFWEKKAEAALNAMLPLMVDEQVAGLEGWLAKTAPVVPVEPKTDREQAERYMAMGARMVAGPQIRAAIGSIIEHALMEAGNGR